MVDALAGDGALERLIRRRKTLRSDRSDRADNSSAWRWDLAAGASLAERKCAARGRLLDQTANLQTPGRRVEHWLVIVRDREEAVAGRKPTVDGLPVQLLTDHVWNRIRRWLIEPGQDHFTWLSCEGIRQPGRLQSCEPGQSHAPAERRFSASNAQRIHTFMAAAF